MYVNRIFKTQWKHPIYSFRFLQSEVQCYNKLLDKLSSIKNDEELNEAQTRPLNFNLVLCTVDRRRCIDLATS